MKKSIRQILDDEKKGLKWKHPDKYYNQIMYSEAELIRERLKERDLIIDLLCEKCKKMARDRIKRGHS